MQEPELDETKTVLENIQEGVAIKAKLDRFNEILEGVSRPAMIFRIVDLPAPLGPTMPIFAPGRNDMVTSSRISGQTRPIDW
jgi:hypothetical protein